MTENGRRLETLLKDCKHYVFLTLNLTEKDNCKHYDEYEYDRKHSGHVLAMELQRNTSRERAFSRKGHRMTILILAVTFTAVNFGQIQCCTIYSLLIRSSLFRHLDSVILISL